MKVLSRFVLFAGVIAVGAFTAFILKSVSSATKSTIVLDVPQGGDFELPSTDGIFSTKLHRGKTLLVSFGFLTCPHICPLTFQRMQGALRSLTAEERQKVQILFISIDPERDSLEKLKQRMNSLGPGFVGATASDDELKKITRLFGARYLRKPYADGSGAFIDHTSSVFVINESGEWAETVQFDSSEKEFAIAIREANQLGPQHALDKKARILEVIGENTSCDLGTADCTITALDKQKLTVSFSKKPVRILKQTNVTVAIENPIYEPEEIDIEGVDTYMGYIRPQLTKTAEGKYEGSFQLPLCEFKKMRWRAKLLLKTPEGEQVAQIFHFTTDQ